MGCNFGCTSSCYGSCSGKCNIGCSGGSTLTSPFNSLFHLSNLITPIHIIGICGVPFGVVLGVVSVGDYTFLNPPVYRYSGYFWCSLVVFPEYLHNYEQ